LDPAIAEDGVALRVLANVMDGLVGYNGDDQLENRLAESYEISPDFKKIEFRIRNSARWSDGKPVKAEEFVEGMRRSFAPATGSKVVAALLPIRGAEKYHLGKSGPESLGVSASGNTLIVELERPTPYIIKAFAMSPAFPVRKDFLERHGDRWTEQHPVTGPYLIEKRNVEHSILLKKNEYYWRDNLGPEKLDFIVIQDESTAVNLFDSGGLDILTRIPITDLKRLSTQGQVVRSPFLATFYIGFNLKSAPFNNKDLRKAVSGLIKRGEIVQALGTGEIPTFSWIPKGVEGSYRQKGDFSKAIALMKKRNLAYVDVVAAFNIGQINSLVMEKIQYDLRRDLGIKLKLLSMDWKSYVKVIQTDPPAIFRYGWSVPFLDPIMMLEVFTSSNPNNFSKWSNAKYDRLVDQIRSMSSGADRSHLIEEAQKILIVDEAVIAPLYQYVQNTAVSQRIKKFKPSVLGVILGRELRL
jgi:oligopeptide transport system substrate-binding protein